MLCRLAIKNVALIDEAEIEFSSGLNVLSGETGSGKSVVLDCINFVLGAKADKSMIRFGEEFCLVSCVFTYYSQAVSDVLAEFDIEDCGELIIKRRFDIKGNGYIKINGESVTAAMLKKITVNLVDVHGQSEHFLLLSKHKQLECIDGGAAVDKEKSDLKAIISKIKENSSALELLGGSPDERARRADMLKYQIDEIENADLKEGEEIELLATKNKAQNLEKITAALASACAFINDDGGALDGINAAKQAVKQISQVSDDYGTLLGGLDECADKLTELGERARDLFDDLDLGEVDLDYVEQRIEVYKSLKRKYGGDLQAVESFLQRAKCEYDDLSKFDERYERLTAELVDLKNAAYAACVALSEKRKMFAGEFCLRVTDKLKQLGMPGAKFAIDFAPLKPIDEVQTFSPGGLDDVEFVFSANVGEPLKSLSKIISGGEMSRFMLALKTQTQSVCGTYVFDEIDAGLSGAAAGIVANNFIEISKGRQIIAISHLPQIAAASDSSLFIEKIENSGKTYTKIKSLDSAEKVLEVVRLIGGNAEDATAKTHAEHLILAAEEFKKQTRKS